MHVPSAGTWPRAYAWSAYMVGLLLILGPPSDVLVQMPDLQFGTVTWRFGFLGLMASAMLLPILGAFIWLVAARAFHHRWMARIVGAGAAVGAVLMIGMLGLFVLDAIQVRNQVRPEVLRQFDPPVIKSLVMQALSVLALGALSWTSFRGWRTGKARDVHRTARDDREILMGQAEA